MRKFCFTGHRKIEKYHAPHIKDVLKEKLRELIRAGAEDFYCGGALGWDTISAVSVLELRKSETPHIKLHLILPCSYEEQTLKWSEEDKKLFRAIAKRADDIEYTSPRYTADCMKRRNARLVEYGDGCICYYDSKTSRSGTAQTVRMARNKGIKIINIYDLMGE